MADLPRSLDPIPRGALGCAYEIHDVPYPGPRSRSIAEGMSLGWVRWFPSDWRGSDRVAQMSPAARGLYAELLMLQAVSGPFRVDRALPARVRMDSADVAALWPEVRPGFVEGPEGVWSNAKMAAEVQRGIEATEQAQRRGRRGAEARWHGTSNGASNACSMPPSNARIDGASNADSDSDSDSELDQNQKGPTAPAGAPRPQRARARVRRGKPRPAPNPVNVAFGLWWERAWLESRGTPWAWSAKERAQVNAARQKADDDLGEMQTRAARMLEHPDQWVAENAAPALLASRWNQLGAVPVTRNKTDQRTKALLRGYTFVEDNDADTGQDRPPLRLA